MKLSNKILIGFFGFAFIYLTAAFAELRLTGSPNVINNKNSIAETVDLSRMAYLIIKDVDKNINVVGADRSRLEVRSLSGDLLKKLKYDVSGDTLMLSGLQLENVRTVDITVFVGKTALKGISVKSSVAIIQDLQSTLLHISQNSGRIYMSGSRIEKIELVASNRSLFDLSATTLDTLSVNVDESQVLVSSSVDVVEGSIKNNARVHLNDIRDIQLRKDESSKLNLYQ
jgi:hypothetical protein